MLCILFQSLIGIIVCCNLTRVGKPDKDNVSIPHRDYCMLQQCQKQFGTQMTTMFQSLIGIIVCCNGVAKPNCSPGSSFNPS